MTMVSIVTGALWLARDLRARRRRHGAGGSGGIRLPPHREGRMGKLALISVTVMAMFSQARHAAEIKLSAARASAGSSKRWRRSFRARPDTPSRGLRGHRKDQEAHRRRRALRRYGAEPGGARCPDRGQEGRGQVPFARAGMGVGFRKGAAKPDVSSADALRKTLLAARSVTYSAARVEREGLPRAGRAARHRGRDERQGQGR